MPPVTIHIVAAESDTGKTTVIEKLIPLLKERGLKFAALKGNLKHFDLSPAGKDSRRFGEAGADFFGLAGKEQFFLSGRHKDLSGLEAAARFLADFDLLLVEGDKKTKNPKIEVVRRTASEKPLLFDRTIALVGDYQVAGAKDIPFFDFNNLESLAAFIIDYIGENKTSENLSASAGGTFTHIDSQGRPRMVDVSEKPHTLREAYASGEITMARKTLQMIKEGASKKGDVLAVAQVAAVLGVKETGRLIPMAHPLNITGVEVDFKPLDEPEPKIIIGVKVRLSAQTGVEMEALTGVSLAALTIYDMCKAVDKEMVIQNIRLLEKKGGRSGHYLKEQ